MSVENPGFAKLVYDNVEIQLTEHAIISARLKVSASQEVVTVSGEVPLLNTTSAEAGVNFDSQRLRNLPLAPNSNVLNAALSVPGVSQLSGGNAAVAGGGVTFSVNGMRTRSNNFVVDGTDTNNSSIGGMVQEINNPDTVGEFRMITNQFSAEYGRAAGSLVSITTKSGTNKLHASAYWRHNDNILNSRSNLDKRILSRAPWRVENQFAGTTGGPIIKNRTFFFGGILRWTDRQFASGASITGAPTEAGKNLLRPFAATRPALSALLEFLPAAQIATGQTVSANIAGQALTVPVGTLSGAEPALLNAWQWMIKGDHRWNDRHSLSSRVIVETRETVSGQSVPPGLTSRSPQERVSANFGVNSTLRPNAFNEFRAGFGRFVNSVLAADPRALTIPSIEITQLGLTGFNAQNTRTAIGLAINNPQASVFNNYQLLDNFSVLRGSHNMKMGFDFRRVEQFSDFNVTIRGRLQYQTLQDVVDDTPNVQTINSFLPGVPRWQAYRYYDYFLYVQDEWRARPNLTLTYGLRYETPGNAIDFLRQTNAKVVALNNNNPAYRMDISPARDIDNWAPRFGFNWRPPELGFLSGEDKLVLRGGYSRVYDLIFNNIVLNVFGSFPFTVVTNFAPRSANGFQKVQDIATGRTSATVANPSLITRTIVNPTYRAPVAEQFSLQLQRQLGATWALTSGWVATKGSGLFMSIDGNPTLPANNASGTRRVDSNRGVIRERANASSSLYHSWQTSLEKRLANNFSLGAHYTWSMFIDDQSEIFNASVAGEVAVAQDSFNRKAERARSTYDRPHRFTANFTWEVPFRREQKGLAGQLLGGWTVANFSTFQSGSPFSALAGVDPGFRLSGIDSLIGNSIRPNATATSLRGMPVEDLFSRRGAQVTVQIPQSVTNFAPALFSLPTAQAPIGNAGRNILRSDGIGNVDLAVLKSFRISGLEGHALSIRGDFFDLTNTRNFGIPEARINSAGFLNQWNTDGGNRRIVLTLRYAF